MATLYVKEVPDSTKDIVTKLAESEGTSLSGYVRRVLNDIAAREQRRQESAAAHRRIKEIHARMHGPRPRVGDGAQVVREIRDEYARGDAP